MDSELKTNLGDGEAAVSSDYIEPRQIDAYWLQRRLGKYSADAIETQRQSDEVLTALKVRYCLFAMTMLMLFRMPKMTVTAKTDLWGFLASTSSI